MGKTCIYNALIVNEGKEFNGYISINNSLIEDIGTNENFDINKYSGYTLYNAEKKLLIPGVIDDQVHFREPGLTHKGCIASESRAAAAGGITSYMEMPNTNPQTTSINELYKKIEIAEKNSYANYSFYLGATNDNIKEINKINPKEVCGVKVFMGSSTGNMLVDNIKSLQAIFAESPVLIATHCEDETIIQDNLNNAKIQHGENIGIEMHPIIRSAEACYKSTALAVELAVKYNSRLHILHLSTERELSLLENNKLLKDKRITGEVCVHHLWFSDRDYKKFGNFIKWNPAIKSEYDKNALIEALINNKLDVVATDHAPHTLEEKQKAYLQAPSGGPLVQHSLIAMLEMYKQGYFNLCKIVDKMCHAPAIAFKIKERGFIRKGYYADLTLINLNHIHKIEKSNIYYKCAWSPFEDIEFSTKVEKTFVNGELIFDNGNFFENKSKMMLRFD